MLQPQPPTLSTRATARLLPPTPAPLPTTLRPHRYSTLDVLEPLWEGLEAGIAHRAADADQVIALHRDFLRAARAGLMLEQPRALGCMLGLQAGAAGFARRMAALWDKLQAGLETSSKAVQVRGGGGRRPAGAGAAGRQSFGPCGFACDGLQAGKRVDGDAWEERDGAGLHAEAASCLVTAPPPRSCGNDFVCSLQCILYRFSKHPCNPPQPVSLRGWFKVNPKPVPEPQR